MADYTAGTKSAMQAKLLTEASLKRLKALSEVKPTDHRCGDGSALVKEIEEIEVRLSLIENVLKGN